MCKDKIFFSKNTLYRKENGPHKIASGEFVKGLDSSPLAVVCQIKALEEDGISSIAPTGRYHLWKGCAAHR